MAAKEGVEFVEFNIIYRLGEYISEAMISLLPTQYSNKSIGSATVLQTFSFEKNNQIAGCRVDEGQLLKSREAFPNGTDKYLIQLIRDQKTLWTGRIDTMRHVKKEIITAGKGMECGVVLEECTEPIQTNDRISCFERIPMKPSLT